MTRLAANLSMLFTEWSFLDRFEQAARVGFRGVEYQFPYDNPPDSVARALRESGLQAVLFNLPPGDWLAGERGLAALPGRERDFAVAVELAVAYARESGCRRLHAMAGVPPEGADAAECEAVMVSNLRSAAQLCEQHGISLLIEPINHRDMPGYLVTRQAQARRLHAAIGCPNVGLQMDLYHCQIVEGDLAMNLRLNLALLEHVQIAGVPGRHEPDSGELHLPWLLSLLDHLGYGGWVGCEYHPRAGTLAGLGWAEPWGVRVPDP